MSSELHRSANLEIHVSDHCNLKCVACSHESPHASSRFEDPLMLRAALAALWRHYEAPLVKLLGGEPLLHPEIGVLVDVVRSVTGSRVRLVTNGVLLKKRGGDLRGLDEIHVSSYPGVRLPTLDEIRTLAKLIGTTITIQRFDSFRWHRTDVPHAPKIIQRVFSTCQMYHNWQCHTLRAGRFYPCPAAATWARATTQESVDLLAPDELISEGLQRLLMRAAPLRACTECLGSVGKLLPHQVSPSRLDDRFSTGMLDERFISELSVDPAAWNNCYEYQYTVHPNGEIERARDVY